MYKQKVEMLEDRIVTGIYRILGTLFGLPSLGIPDLLNRQDRPFIPIGDPQLFTTGAELPNDDELRAKTDFLALPKDEIWWIVGGGPGQPPGTVVGDRSLVVLFNDHLLRGRLKVSGHIRTSDYIAQRAVARPFDTLYDATLCKLEPGASMADLPGLEEFEHVTVNLRRNTGVCEVALVPRPKSGEEASFVLKEDNEWVP